MKIILEAIVGSHAYGLATPDSDIDKMGIFVEPTEKILSLHKPKDTRVSVDPDITLHEVEKFMKLACKANPTVLELLFLDEYETLTEEGKLLIDNRNAFLSKRIKDSYGGYAVSQARKLEKRAFTDKELDKPLKEVTRGFSARTSNRAFKHARHCFRLLEQGTQLLKTGTLDIKVHNKEELMTLGDMTVNEVVDKFEQEFKKFKKIDTVLTDNANYEFLNKVLLQIRKINGYL